MKGVIQKWSIIALGIVLSFVMASSVAAFDASKTGLKKTADVAGILKVGGNQNLPTIVGNVIGTGLAFVSVLFFILMLYGGILWMTARGNDDQTKKALGTIIAATVGIIIVLASYALTNFVFQSIGPQGSSSVPAPVVCAAIEDQNGCSTAGDGNQCTWNEDFEECQPI